MFGRNAMAFAVAGLLLCACPGATASARPPAAGKASTRASPPAKACAGADAMIVDEATRLQAVASLLCLVNQQRTVARLSTLRASTPLASAAAEHSSAMVSRRFFGHARANGLRKRALRWGYMRTKRRATLGETLAWAAGPMATPAQLLTSFMESPEHRRTLLHGRFRDAGIGITLGAPLRRTAGPAATITVDLGRR